MQIPHLVGSNVLATTVKGHKVTHFKPFDPVSKLTEATVVHNDSNAVFKVAKGVKERRGERKGRGEELKSRGEERRGGRTKERT